MAGILLALKISIHKDKNPMLFPSSSYVGIYANRIRTAHRQAARRVAAGSTQQTGAIPHDEIAPGSRALVKYMQPLAWAASIEP